MIDLDELEEQLEGHKLYCWFGVALITRRINYAEWRIITTKFRLFSYVLPGDRSCSANLVDVVYYIYKCNDLSFLVAAGMLLRNIESHYTEQQQLAILDIIQTL